MRCNKSRPQTVTSTTMTALPLLSEVEKELDESGQGAWKRLLDAEKLALAPSANALVAPVAEYNNLLVGTRVIGRLQEAQPQHLFRRACPSQARSTSALMLDAYAS